VRPYVEAVSDRLSDRKLTQEEQEAIYEVTQEFAGTVSFQDLAEAVQRFGFKAVGLSLSFEQLKALRIPAIAHLSYLGQDHFSVLRGIRHDGLVWLSDPSWGNRKFSESQFKAMWKVNSAQNLRGEILLIFPKDKHRVEINEDFFKPPKVER